MAGSQKPLIFNEVPVKSVGRNSFDLSHAFKFDGDIGIMQVIACEPTMPGDTFNLKSDVFARVMPLVNPVLHRFKINIEWHYQPYRPILSKWRQFIGGERDGSDYEGTTPYCYLRDLTFTNQRTMEDAYGYPFSDSLLTPWQLDVYSGGNIANKGFALHSLADFLGFPTARFVRMPPDNLDYGIHPDQKIDLRPFIAYQSIYFNTYCDQNFLTKEYENAVPAVRDVMNKLFYNEPLDMGHYTDPDVLCFFMTLRNRCYSKDYFTSALPFPQRGEDVKIPLTSETADVISSGPFNLVEFAVPTGGNTQPGEVKLDADGNLTDRLGQKLQIYPSGSMEASLQAVTMATISQLRTASTLQQYYEILARSGSRYKEVIRAVFDTDLRDSTIDMPVFIGGQSTLMTVSDVEQTSATSSGTTPLGTLGGKATVVGSGIPESFFTDEHGLILGILTIVPDSDYCQGFPAKYDMWTRYDYAMHLFDDIGEQPIKNKEVYSTSLTSALQQDEEFGYTPRFAQWKVGLNRLGGEFKNTLRKWTGTRMFDYPPALNTDFVSIKPVDYNHLFAVEDAPGHFLFEVYNNIYVKRKLAFYGVPYRL